MENIVPSKLSNSFLSKITMVKCELTFSSLLIYERETCNYFNEWIWLSDNAFRTCVRNLTMSLIIIPFYRRSMCWRQGLVLLQPTWQKICNWVKNKSSYSFWILEGHREGQGDISKEYPSRDEKDFGILRGSSTQRKKDKLGYARISTRRTPCPSKINFSHHGMISIIYPLSRVNN